MGSRNRHRQARPSRARARLPRSGAPLAGARAHVVGIGVALGCALGMLPAVAAGPSTTATDPAPSSTGAAAAPAEPVQAEGLLVRVRGLLGATDSGATPVPVETLAAVPTPAPSTEPEPSTEPALEPVGDPGAAADEQAPSPPVPPRGAPAPGPAVTTEVTAEPTATSTADPAGTSTPSGPAAEPTTDRGTDEDAAALLQVIRDLLGLEQDTSPDAGQGASPDAGQDAGAAGTADDPAAPPEPTATGTPSTPGVADAPTTDDGAPAGTPATSPPAAPGDGPFAAGRPWVDPASDAAQAAAAATDPTQQAALGALAAEGHATWVGDWTPDPEAEVREVADAAVAAGQTPFLALYAIPDRDCSGGHSAGGVTTPGEYTTWVDQVATSLAGSSAVVVLEPDALAGLDCLDPAAQAQRLGLLADASATLTAAGATVYLDAGVPGWQPVDEIAARLRAAGVGGARGFALNVANHQTVAANTAYGDAIVAALGGSARYLVDTSRNGAGPPDADPGTEAAWCNPPGRAVGPAFTTDTPSPHLDALAWVKVPGASDGTCNGGAPAGTFDPDRAADLARALTRPATAEPASPPTEQAPAPAPATTQPPVRDDDAALLARLRDLLAGT